MSKTLSIIVPVYNGELYIESCLNSILEQRAPDVEVVVVNDGSSDSTHQIISSTFKAYIENDELIYLPIVNGGVSAARNLGIDHARGNYIAFVDADDFVSEDYLKIILSGIKTEPEIIEFGCNIMDQNGRTKHKKVFAHTKFGMHPNGTILDTVFSSFLWYPALRVFKRNMFENTRFPEGVRFCEDLIALSEIYSQGGTVLTLPNILYNYRINSAGATLNPKPDYADNLIKFYRSKISQAGFPSKALRINLAYIARSCIEKTTDPLGRLPADIESDIKTLLLTPRIFFIPRRRMVMFAVFGPFLNRIKLAKKYFEGRP